MADTWKRPDAVIVNDRIRTATVENADLVLPASVPFERNDTAIADPNVLPGPVVLPPGAWYNLITDKTGRRVDIGGNPDTVTHDQGSSSFSRGASAGDGSLTQLAVNPINPR
ncbi:MAG: molybdopterin-dependent oxidoreductase [Rhodobacter sp.]|nr:molybdopterin-dependent oxidoreductase [Rhodobacter sp.]